MLKAILSIVRVGDEDVWGVWVRRKIIKFISWRCFGENYLELRCFNTPERYTLYTYLIYARTSIYELYFVIWYNKPTRIIDVLCTLYPYCSAALLLYIIYILHIINKCAHMQETVPSPDATNGYYLRKQRFSRTSWAYNNRTRLLVQYSE